MKASPMTGLKFKRGLDDEFVKRLNRMYQDGGWWKKLMDDGELFLAIRNNYVNFYYRGASILKLSWFPTTKKMVGEIHYKYLLRPGIRGKKNPYLTVDDGGIALPELHQLFFDNINSVSSIKRTAKLYAGDEKSSVHHVALSDSNKVVDLEVTFSEEENESAPRMDLAALRQVGEGAELAFFEAKEFSNHRELRKKGEASPEVVDKIEQYSRILKTHSEAITRSFRHVCKNLHELQGVADRFPERSRILKEIVNDSKRLAINKEPRLLILGCDKDQKEGRNWKPHMDKLTDRLPGRVRIAGSGKSAGLSF